MPKHAPKKDRSKLAWRLLTVAVVVFFLAAGIYFLLASTRESKRLEQNLIDRFGRAYEYTPAADGFIPPARVEAFIRVRQAVQPSCTDYQEVLGGIIGLAEIETDADLSGKEKASRGIGAFKSMVKVGPKMLQFMDARNTRLQTEEMGLGEYMFIYLAAYGEQLALASDSPYAEMQEGYVSARIRDEYAKILVNQLAALNQARGDLATEGLAAELRAEIQALDEGSHESPWPNGPPARTRESLAPFKERVSELYCDGLVSVELLQKNRGLNFRD